MIKWLVRPRNEVYSITQPLRSVPREALRGGIPSRTYFKVRPSHQFLSYFPGYNDPRAGRRRRDQLPVNFVLQLGRSRAQALAAAGRLVRAFVRESSRFIGPSGQTRGRLRVLYTLGRRLGFTAWGVQSFIRLYRQGAHSPLIRDLYEQIRRYFSIDRRRIIN